MLFVVITMVVVIVFWALIEWAAIIGLFGVMTGERIGRCSQCHHFGLTMGGKLHPQGCPPTAREHLLHALYEGSRHIHPVHRLHFGHH